jgi:SNF2 family DNA or RNA helicase
LSLSLYPYQETGAKFLVTAGSALMADEMGVGKTVQSIEALRRTGATPALVVTRASVKATWARELERWAPELRVAVAPSGTVRALKVIEANDYDVLVVSWDAIRSLSKLAKFGSIKIATCSECDPNSTGKPASCEREHRALNMIEWKTVIADEAHRAKDPHAKQTRALWALGDQATRRYALTGTPIANSPVDLWSVMRFVSPDEYPAKTAWIDRYGLKVPNYFSGFDDVVGFRPDRREELDKFFLPRFIRRLKAQVQPDLPPKVYERRDVELKGKQKTAYNAMRKEMLAEVESGMLFAENALVQVGRLRQLAVAYGEMDGDDFRLSEPSSTLDELDNILEDLGDRQVVVFADSRQLLDLAEARFQKHGFTEYGALTGAYNEEQRNAALEQFREGQLGIMLVQASVGGEGVDGLQVADVAVFLERPWSAVLNAQCEDRLHRIGQNGSSVLYIDVVATDTIQERVFEVLREKAAKLEDLVQDEDRMRRWLK